MAPRFRIEVELMLAIYPLPDLPTVGTVRKLCDAYILESRDAGDVTREPRRGRPSLPWDLFHVEVAARAKDGTLPEKKEAAISEFTDWFRDRHGVAVSRSSVGQKLTPYYHKFFRPDRENAAN